MKKAEQAMWRALKLEAQNEINKLELNITFPFRFETKHKREKTKSYSYLLCLADSKNIRDAVVSEMRNLGYICNLGNKTIISPSDSDNDHEYEDTKETKDVYYFKVYLQKSSNQVLVS